MTRHAKNSTASSVYSYHERKRDAETSGYGTQSKRLSKDSVNSVSACNLSLQPSRNPVITPDGYLYDKEAILEYIIHQKRDLARKMKQYELNKQKDEQEFIQKQQAVKLKNFLKTETKILVDKHDGANTSASVGASISNMSNGQDKKLPSFWIPDLTPSSCKKIEKPSTVVTCPMSGKHLKANRLIPIKFTPVDPAITDPRKAVYKCAVTGDILTNASKCVVLKTSCSVVTEDCVNKIIKKEMIDPINGKSMKDSDFIYLQRGGTGYAGANELQAKIHNPVMTA